MFKKKTSALLITLLIFMQSISGFGFVNQANAAVISSNIIDSVSLAVYDSSNHVVTDNVYEQGSKVQVDYTWSFPNSHGYHSGDTFTFTLPQQFLLVNNVTGPLVSGNGDVGTFVANYLTHQVVMTFNENIGLDEVQGTLTFNTKFDMSKITGSTNQTISIPVKGGTQVFSLNFKPNVASTIGKNGVPEGYNAKNIDWTIDVNKKLEPVQNAVVTDPIPVGLSVPVTVAVYDLGINLDGTPVQGALTDTSKYTFNTTGGILTVQFTEASIDTAYRIKYTTPVTDFDKTSFLNKATFSGSNKTPVDASATVTVQQGTALDKTSSGYNSSTQTIDWAIKYNYNERAIVQASAYLTDLFDNTQALVGGVAPSSIKVYPVTLDNSGAESLGSALPVSDYTVNAAPTPPTGKTGFKLQFNNPITQAYKLVYQTKAINRVEGPATISNTATTGLGATDTATRDIDQVIIIKSVNSKDYHAKTVDWKIALNADSESMSSVVLTDNFPKKGLEYRPGTLFVTQGSTTLNSPADYSISNVLNDTGFTINFVGTLTAPVTVSYSTYYNNDWILPVGSTTNFLNDATVNWTGTLPSQEITVHGTFTPRDEVKNNGFKNGSYNAATKQLTWVVGVNYNGKTINHAVVKDLLESQQKLVPGSLKVYEMNIPVNGNPTMGAFVNGSEYDYLVDSGNTLILNFKAAISKAYYIVYSTSLDGELIDTNVSNTANVYETAAPVSKNLTATVNIPKAGEYVNKNGTQSGDKINWTININRGQSTVDTAKITDIPSDNQFLLPDSFHLYATSVASDSSITKTTELLKGTDYNVVILTDNDGKQKFELTFTHQISKPYILEYQSLIVANDNDTVSNQVSFTGSNDTTVSKSTSKNVIVAVSSGSGTGSGVRGSLAVKKVDSGNHALLLNGATFELYRKTGATTKILFSTLTTDSTGIVLFKNLLQGDYVLKEVAAPTGYTLDSSERAVTINSTTAINLEVTNVKVPPVVVPTPTPAVPTPTPTPVVPTPTPVVPTPTPTVPTPTPTPSSGGGESTPAPSTSPSPSPSASPKPTPSASPTPAPSASPTPAPSASPTPAPSASPTPKPQADEKVTNQDTPIEGNIEVPLGSTPSIGKQPENGTVTIDPNGHWVYTPNPGFTGNESIKVVLRNGTGEATEATIDIEVQKVPLGNKKSGQTLPQTGEASRRYYELAGFALIIAGVVLRRRRLNK
ncbi:hypothetical protein GCM10008018_52300 [Paenibacillus marchantiophytorum]|uniref:LPXTG cell wall anchor domain-containing protein n=1 Tax=Paenibacillus marchantiophytorum TaxID=1619310 RepID=A0ABQ1F4A9_9BACL|nr:collagen binding domain-containing protein [Paenibacillus marchantiophytorum]GFZ99597.1 hypothetical protein GCM10008018_52300 [Paenibacillus marchantiophytorum]